MKAYAGIDLHSSNNYIGIMDQDYKRLFGRRLPNNMNNILKVLEPFKADLEGVIVESTYNWYWLVDGLQEHGYTVHLANPSAIKQLPEILELRFLEMTSRSFIWMMPAIYSILRTWCSWPKIISLQLSIWGR